MAKPSDGLGRALCVESVSKTYRGASTPANYSISLDFAPGQLVALIGHNGAGKTTLLSQVIGSTKPDSGDIRYRGQSLATNPDLARRVSSMMPQLHAPLTGVTPEQAIASVARIRGADRQEAAHAAHKIIADLRIDPWRKVKGEKLSGGLLRLTSFAMSVAIPAPTLLIDEPTNDVDPERRPLIWAELRRLADNGHIVIVVTHNLSEIEHYADRYILLQRGRVLADSAPAKLTAQTGAAVLTVSTRPGVTVSPPPALGVAEDASGPSMRISLDKSQVPAAVDWVLARVSDGSAENYSLTPSSLANAYQELTADGI